MYYVRKAVASSIPQLADLGDIFAVEKIIDIVKGLLSDNSEPVRSECIDGVIQLCEKSNLNDENLSDLIPSIKKGFEDSSWRLRKSWIERITRLFRAIHRHEESRDMLWAVFLQALKDKDKQVREAALTRLGSFIEFVKDERYNDTLLPKIKDLQPDSTSEDIELALRLYQIIGKES